MSGENIIAPNFDPKPRDRMKDHVWVMFALADISTYFEERNLPQVAAVLQETIRGVEAEILSSPSSPIIKEGANFHVKEPTNPMEVEPHLGNLSAT